MNELSCWRGVVPAITTAFTQAGDVDHDFLARHANWLVDAGCSGIVPLGSLGEGATLTFEEKLAIVRTLVAALGSRAPVIAGIAALSTGEAVRLARECERLGARGLLVLPPYVYSSDWREMGAHLRAVLAATALPVLLYNNPLAYRTDFSPEQVAELATEFPQVVAIKESSGDIRRFAALRALLGGRLQLMVGIDDALVEGVAMGATGWIAGVVNAFPAESVRLFELARSGGSDAAMELYSW
ncbi:MAG: dihydrodipicolinate synthase family protein, partial [Rhodanobacteraceae bacterium]|nr:dihydrodipicolinate synthase family protein [Rhodanobacteraceae bacterium]